MNIHELPYTPDAAELFKPYARTPYSVFFDSGHPHDQRERYSIIVADPIVKIIVHGDETTIIYSDHRETTSSDPMTVVKQLLQELNHSNKNPVKINLPFKVGAVGYFGYDFARRYFTIPKQTTFDITVPDAFIGIYDWSLVVDHQDKKTWLITLVDSCFRRNNENLPSHPRESEDRRNDRTAGFKITSPFKSNFTFDEYQKAFFQIKNHIRQGDCYQVNLCQRFSAPFIGSPWHAYQQLRRASPTPFSAFINLDQQAVLCLSPERFLSAHNGFVETKPIKGTAARFDNPLDDRRSAQQLLHSEKDKAENIMIVDLLRNDLGKICNPGTIRVSQLATLESFPNVHHLVSTITGQLREDQHAIDLWRHCFPGGSITGAPKQRAMQIIESIEPHHRSVYCGSVGYIDIDGDMDCNITIRTLICDRNHIYCYAGGAIVDDSECESEYEETKIKVAKLLTTLGNL